jgi:hypothetical protein
MLDDIKFLAWQDYAGLNLNQNVKPKNKRKKTMKNPKFNTPENVQQLIELMFMAHARYDDNLDKAKAICMYISDRWYKSCHANDVEKIIKLTT